MCRPRVFPRNKNCDKIDVTKRHVRVVESLETGLAFCERIALRNSNAALGRAQSAHLRKAATVKTGLSSSPSPASIR